MKNILFIIIISLGIAGCASSIYEPDAVGVGYNVNEMKLSPCACMQVKQKPGLMEWQSDQI